MKMKKKSIILFSLIFLMVLMLSAGTYAYWIWNSNTDKNVVFNTVSGVEKYIVYDEGNSYFIGDFQPNDNFCEAANTTVSFYKTGEATSIMLNATIFMDVNSIGANITTTDDIYWVITTGDNNITCDDGLNSSEVVNYGTFNGVTSGSVLTLASDIEV